MCWPVVRLHVRPSGERIPLLVDRDIGVPLQMPTLYVLTALRSRAQPSRWALSTESGMAP